MDTLKDIEKLKQAIEKKAGRTMRSPVRFRSAILFDSRKHPRTNQSFHPKTTLGIRILLSHAPVFVSIHLGSLHRLPRLGCILPIFTHDNRILLFYKRTSIMQDDTGMMETLLGTLECSWTDWRKFKGLVIDLLTHK